MKDPEKKISRRRYRTRRDILEAASRVVGTGGYPTIEEIASEAMVSRATVYRYFPNIETLLMEASVDIETPDPDEFFGNDQSMDPAERLNRAEAALHRVVYRNEQALRNMLAGYLMDQGKKGKREVSIPARQNRRTSLIEAGLSPVRCQMNEATYEKLCAALALVFGLESMIVFQDVIPMSSRKARSVKCWMINALVNEAMKDRPDK